MDTEMTNPDLWTMVRVASCSYDVVLLALVVVVFVSAVRVKRSIGAYVFGAAMLGVLLLSLALEAMDAMEIGYDVSRWIYAFGSVADVLLAVVALAGMVLIRPRVASARAAS